MTRPEARAGPVTHAQKPRRKRKWWAVCWLLGSVLIPMEAERESDSAELPGSEALLDAVLRTLYDLGETEGETEQKRTRKKKEKKRDSETVADGATEPLPRPASPGRGQRKSASSFFKELREELQSAPAAPSEVPTATTAVSLFPLENNSKLVEVVEFHSRSEKRKPKSEEDEPAKVMDRLARACVVRVRCTVTSGRARGPRATFRPQHLVLTHHSGQLTKVAKPDSPEESEH